MNEFKFFIILITLLATSFGQRPNIVVIVADDLGWGDVSFHGQRQIVTPNMDALASESVVLNNYYVSPLCSPTRGALLTGRHPAQLGLQHLVIQAGEPWGLPLEEKLLPQYLRPLGYSTVGVGKWHLGFHRRQFLPTNRGFDSFFGYWASHIDYWDRTHQSVHIKNASGRGIDLHNDERPETRTKYNGTYGTDLWTEKAIAVIKKQAVSGKQPLFLYLAHQAVHGANGYDPLQAPNYYKRRFSFIRDGRRRTQAAMTSALDDSVGRIVETLDQVGVLNNTIIVFTTDNGGPVTEGDSGIRSNFPLRGGKLSYWEGGVRGTAFVWSKLLNASYVSNHLMHVTDLMPTIYRAAGGNVSDLGAIEGKDFWNTLKTNGASPRRHLLHNIDQLWQNWAVRTGDFKLVKMGPFEQRTNQNYRPLNFNDSVVYPNITGWSSDPRQSPVARVLAKLNSRPIKLVKSIVKCVQPAKTTCRGANRICLFDVQNDPCEYNDLSKSKPEIVDRLTKVLKNYNQTVIRPGNKPLDWTALPVYHNNRWTNWLDHAERW